MEDGSCITCATGNYLESNLRNLLLRNHLIRAYTRNTTSNTTRNTTSPNPKRTHAVLQLLQSLPRGLLKWSPRSLILQHLHGKMMMLIRRANRHQIPMRFLKLEHPLVDFNLVQSDLRTEMKNHEAFGELSKYPWWLEDL